MTDGKTCAFFGHRLWSVVDFDTLFNFVKNLVQEKNITRFLVGEHGKFDELAFKVCLEIIKIYPQIKLCFVNSNVAPTKHKKLTVGDIYRGCEEISYFVEDVHFKARITKTNRSMVDDCDIVVCCVDMATTSSGARRAVVYAKKKGKEIYNLYPYKKSGVSHQFA